MNRLISMVGVVATSLTLFACAGMDDHDDDDRHHEEEKISISLNELAIEAAKSEMMKAESSANENIAAAVRSATHDDAVTRLVLDRNIPVSYEYIATLMRQSNAFGAGAACVMCHSSNDPSKSYRGLDLTTCEGIKRGSMEEPQRKIIYPGKKASKSLLRNHLRNNRMPFGVAFDYPTDAPNIIKVKNGSMRVRKMMPTIKITFSHYGPRKMPSVHLCPVPIAICRIRSHLVSMSLI